jgi:hypothetical protein
MSKKKHKKPKRPALDRPQKPRNYVCVAALFRQAGAHGKTRKALRRGIQNKMTLSVIMTEDAMSDD